MHGIYKLDGDIPETIISGKTLDISQFCEFDCFKWVIFQDKTRAYPNDHFRLGRYLDLSIDIGPALTMKVIKNNGQVVHRSTYHALTQDEWELEECKNECSLFMESLHQALCYCMRLSDFVDLDMGETPQYDPHDDELQNAETFTMLDEEPKVTTEWGDQYVNAEIMLPRGDKMVRDQVMHQKLGADYNQIGRSNKNLTLDIHLYEVEFPGGEMTELHMSL